jgi:hypothetical protein
MKSLSLFLVSFSICLFGGILRAEESAMNSKSSAGIFNDLLRKESPSASAWDIGLQFRTRSEAKDAGSFPNRDFAQNLDHSNDYFLFRTKVHLGWTPAKWITAYVEGRDSYDVSDSRTVPESDRIDLYQAYVRLGDPESGSGRSQNGYGLNRGYSSYVGQELDLLVDWRPVTWGQARIGYGHFFVGDCIHQSINSVPANGRAEDANWFYMQVSTDF